ncbi:MAG: hypothetical protein H0X24_06920, partial [Ktedonobacterales bacterium]|nr:hypothetical protein [Ktedonobacterales bacterium]
SCATVYDAYDIHTYGALNSAGIERYPGADQVATLRSGLVIIGLVALLIGVILSVVFCVRHRLWGWVPLVVAGLLVSTYATLQSGFTADPFVALLTLLAPVALLVLSGQRGATNTLASSMTLP